MDQVERVVGPVEHELAVHRQGLAEPAFLERDVAEQLQRVVTPGAAEGQIDHLAERGGVALALPSRNHRSAWLSTRFR